MKENKQTSVFNNSLIWFGAGVSIAEIITGTYFAPLGFAKGIGAIIIGHLIGCALLFFAGYIGAVTKKSSMETTGISFGKMGSKFFAIMNVAQLVGWTGIMIYDGALSINKIFNTGAWIWAFIIGALIVVRIAVGIKNLEAINTIAMSALFILTIVLCKVIFFGTNSATQISQTAQQAISFGAAVELAVAMPLSWIPLISDYTKDAEKPFLATLTSSITYGIVSTWMYIIGMGAALFTGEGDIVVIMVKAGLGIAALIIVILSTVTTAYLDAYSAGVSGKTIVSRVSEKWIGVAVTALGTLGAIFLPMDNITNFLYFIGSVFTPMIAILLADYFIVKTDSTQKILDIKKILIWLVGFIIYRILMKINLVIGNTVPDMLITFILTVVTGKISTAKTKKEEKI